MVPTIKLPLLSDARLLFLLVISPATVQVVHCPLHPFSASASKLTGWDSLPHHIDQSVQIELWLWPQLSFLLVLYHLKWQQCLWASWKRINNNNYRTRSMIRSKLPCFPRALPLESRGKGETWVCLREIIQQSESGAKMEEHWYDNQPQISVVMHHKKK